MGEVLLLKDGDFHFLINFASSLNFEDHGVLLYLAKEFMLMLCFVTELLQQRFEGIKS